MNDAVAVPSIDRLVPATVWSFLVIGIGGIIGILWDTAHIPSYVFRIEIPWMGRAAHIPWAMVGVGSWFVVNALLCGRAVIGGKGR